MKHVTVDINGNITGDPSIFDMLPDLTIDIDPNIAKARVKYGQQSVSKHLRVSISIENPNGISYNFEHTIDGTNVPNSVEYDITKQCLTLTQPTVSDLTFLKTYSIKNHVKCLVIKFPTWTREADNNGFLNGTYIDHLVQDDGSAIFQNLESYFFNSTHAPEVGEITVSGDKLIWPHADPAKQYYYNYWGHTRLLTGPYSYIVDGYIGSFKRNVLPRVTEYYSNRSIIFSEDGYGWYYPSSSFKAFADSNSIYFENLDIFDTISHFIEPQTDSDAIPYSPTYIEGSFGKDLLNSELRYYYNKGYFSSITQVRGSGYAGLPLGPMFPSCYDVQLDSGNSYDGVALRMQLNFFVENYYLVTIPATSFNYKEIHLTTTVSNYWQTSTGEYHSGIGRFLYNNRLWGKEWFHYNYEGTLRGYFWTKKPACTDDLSDGTYNPAFMMWLYDWTANGLYSLNWYEMPSPEIGTFQCRSGGRTPFGSGNGSIRRAMYSVILNDENTTLASENITTGTCENWFLTNCLDSLNTIYHLIVTGQLDWTPLYFYNQLWRWHDNYKSKVTRACGEEIYEDGLSYERPTTIADLDVTIDPAASADDTTFLTNLHTVGKRYGQLETDLPEHVAVINGMTVESIACMHPDGIYIWWNSLAEYANGVWPNYSSNPPSNGGDKVIYIDDQCENVTFHTNSGADLTPYLPETVSYSWVENGDGTITVTINGPEPCDDYVLSFIEGDVIDVAL